MARSRPPVDYRALARKDATKYGVPPAIFERQIDQESHFDPNAHSSAGAEGIAQFIPSTAKGFGLTNPYDPVASLDAAARYDSGLMKKYGSIARALSAYNSGRPDAYKDPGFAKGQTYNYVRSILGGVSTAAPPATGSTMRPGAMSTPEMSAGMSTPAPDQRRQLLMALANEKPGQQADLTPFLDLLRQRSSFPASAGTTPGPVPASTPAPATASGSLAELLHEGVGGPTHSTGEHIHAASTDPKVVLALIAEAQRRGLSVRENPYVDPVDPVHAPNSFHKRTFPGKFNGRSLGEAVDVSGPQMSAYEQWVRKTYGGAR